MTALVRLARAATGLGRWFALSVVLGAATVAAGIGLVGTAAWLIATAALAPPLGTLRVAIAGVRFFGLARAVLRYADRLVAHDLALRLLARLRGWILARLEPLAPGRLLEQRAADLASRLVGDVETLEMLPVRGLAPPVVTLLTVLGSGLLVGAVEPRLGLALALTMTACATLVPAVTLLVARPALGRATALASHLVPPVVDTIQGAAELAAWRAGEPQLARIERLSAALLTSELRRERIAAAGAAVLAALGQWTPWLLLVLGLGALAQGTIDGVQLAVAVLVGLAAFEALEPLPAAAAALDGQVAAARRVTALIELPPTVSDPLEPAVSEPHRHRLGPLAVSLRGVELRLPGAAGPILADVDLEVPAGGSLAVVGPSGAGKSTLARLLARVWDPTAGVVEVGGIDLRRWRLDALRATVGLLGQDTRLVAGSIRDNLKIVAPAADDAILAEACAAAGLAEEIAAWPAGLDTWIGEGGLALSGGQRRRLEIARTWLADPAVVVLDEPTAHLDPVTERAVLDACSTLLRGRTAVLITHRLRVAARADTVALLVNGRVAAVGRHASLIEGDGLYSRWWRLERELLPAG